MEEDEAFVQKEFSPSANFNFRLTKQQIFKLKQVFDAYDDDCDGVIGMEFLGSAMRASGLLISDQEISDVKKALELEGVVSSIELGRFFILMATKFRDAGDMEKTVATAFRSIYNDPDDPLTKDIPLKVLRLKFSASGGEPFSEEQMDAWLRDIPPSLLSTDGNKADFDGLINWVLQDLPDLKDEEESKSQEQAEKETGLETGKDEAKEGAE